MNRDEFSALLRDLLFNIHDTAVLEKQRRYDIFPRIENDLNRAENLRSIVREGIEALRPREGAVNVEALEWRYYLILHGRYIEGQSIPELQKKLSLGDRQERRLHGRALSALENILWERFFGPQPPADEPADASPEDESGFGYQIVLEPLQLERVIQDVALLCQPRIEDSGGSLTIDVPAALPPVQSDRIILRQIALDLVSRILQKWTAPVIQVSAATVGSRVGIEILVENAAQPALPEAEDSQVSHEQFYYWMERLSAGFSIEAEDEKLALPVRYSLSLPRVYEATILVVDDHEPAVRIVQRFLIQSNTNVIGTSDPSQVLGLARSLHPQAILLDVMMPGIDGWELLQALKSDPETQQIPVIICSVWDQPELAFSLGANAFLKKPISQAELLDELVRLNLLGTSVE